jgi:uncharacterized protein YyaL (SSP411 family)
MLYDNAQLARVYVEAFQLTGDECYAQIARETLDYVLREMTEPGGGFRSATDADSEGREGTYFVWRKSEIDELLGPDAALFQRAYGVTKDGNFEDVHHPRLPGEEGMNVLHVAITLEDLVTEGVEPAELDEKLARCRSILYEHRRSRTYPGLDDKVLTSWNGLMIGSMAYSGRVLGEQRYLMAATRAAEFVLHELKSPAGRLLRTHRAGRSKIPAFLDDYAFLAGALLDLYEATFDGKWFREASELVEEMTRLFWDGQDGAWFHTASDGEELIARMKTPSDGSIPSGNAEALHVVVRLAAMTADPDLRDRADQVVQLFHGAMERMPGGGKSRSSATPKWRRRER